MSGHGTHRIAQAPQNDPEILQVEIKNEGRSVSLPKLQDLDKIQHVISLVLNPSDGLEERIVNVPKDSIMSEAVFIKQEKFDSDEDVIMGDQLEEMDISKCRVLPVNDEVVETSSPQRPYGKRSDEATGKGGSHILKSSYSTSNRVRQNKIRYKVIEDGIEYYPSAESEDFQIMKNDPRTRMHFVKYVKIDNKTVKIWECGICGKEFRHQYTLMRHLPTHTDERNFKCEACGKAFRQMSTLSQHRAIHSDARPYVCELCKKTFNRVSTLISHRKTHSEHKPHKCSVCGKGFHQKGNLRNHIFTHTNERPYKCDVCGKGFNQMSNLMCHKASSEGLS